MNETSNQSASSSRISTPRRAFSRRNLLRCGIALAAPLDAMSP
jgi:hypothetical protein